MIDEMSAENAWFLKDMMTRINEDFAENEAFVHRLVKEILKFRRYENRIIITCK